jgi:hypothetical protein
MTLIQNSRRNCTVLNNIAFQRLILIVLHSSGLADESSVQFIEDRVEPTCLTMSPDSNYVAVGLGTYIHLFKFKGSHRQWQTTLSVPDFALATEVRFQSMSFSADSSSLIVSTQRHDTLRSPDDDSVSTYVWQCSRQPDPPRKMGSCSMPTASTTLPPVEDQPVVN